MKKNTRKKVCLTIEEAINILEKMKSKSTFLKEIKLHKNKKDWVIEGDEPDEDGQPKFYIIENNEENNRALFQHKPIDLNG